MENIGFLYIFVNLNVFIKIYLDSIYFFEMK